MVGLLCLILIFPLFKEIKKGLNSEDNIAQKPKEDYYSDDNIHIEKIFDYSSDIYTQGLDIDKDNIYISSGLYNKSKIIKYNYKTEETIDYYFDKNYFVEGLTVLNNQLWVTTFRENTVFSFNLNNLTPEKTFSIDGEGWGLTTDGERIIMSNGSNIITFYDPTDFNKQKELIIKDDQKNPVNYINDLVYTHGFFYANIYKKDIVVKINSETGEVIKTYDLSVLRDYIHDSSLELNGITYISNNQFLITGKNWDKIFLVELK